MKARTKIAGIIIIVLCATGGISAAVILGTRSPWVSTMTFTGYPDGTNLATASPGVWVPSSTGVTIVAGGGVATIAGTGQAFMHFPVKGGVGSSIEITCIIRCGTSQYLIVHDAAGRSMVNLHTGYGQIETYNPVSHAFSLLFADARMKTGNTTVFTITILNGTHYSVSFSWNNILRSAIVPLYYVNASRPASILTFGASGGTAWNIISIRTSWNANFSTPA